jgi:hypothetical protein
VEAGWIGRAVHRLLMVSAWGVRGGVVVVAHLRRKEQKRGEGGAPNSGS